MLKLNRNQIKYILIIAMLIDHIAWAFVPMESVLGEGMHFIGRLTGPAMAVLLAEGYQYTKNKKKYALRLFVFALISWMPFCLFEFGKWPDVSLGVIFTLFLAFMVLWMWEQLNIPLALKVVLVIVACIVSIFGDWPIVGILWALYAYIYRDNPKAKWISFCVITVLFLGFIMFGSAFSSDATVLTELKHYIFMFGIFMVPILLVFFYNGKKGSSHPIHKWFFYIFYPAHLLVLYFIKLWL